MAAESRFRAMGSDAHVVVVGDPALVDAARARIDDLEQRWSRFIASSEVSRLNARSGEWAPVSPDTALLIELAIEAWHLSGGAYDPTLLGAVTRAGYDRSFESLGPAPPPRYSPLAPGADRIELRPGSVRLPPGVGFDPGGIGKGLAADIVVGELLVAGADGVCVNLGGDVRVAGVGPDGEGWTIAVHHPWNDVPLARLGIADGAVATSTTLLRRWESKGTVRHHLIDPQTGRPAETDINFVSVVSGQAWMAEVLAKAVLLHGGPHPFDALGGTAGQGLAVDGRGTVLASPGLHLYLDGVPLRRSLRVPDLSRTVG
ncbi:MAG: FAD:protein FMN transferase, partial [Actinobacteria bacterium]|nr:FAD:protein FMN transferase [Actinomycetota bacterium]